MYVTETEEKNYRFLESAEEPRLNLTRQNLTRQNLTRQDLMTIEALRQWHQI